MDELICVACRYKFKQRREGVIPDRCPYCAATGTVKSSTAIYGNIFKSVTGEKPQKVEKAKKQAKPSENDTKVRTY